MKNINNFTLIFKDWREPIVVDCYEMEGKEKLYLKENQLFPFVFIYKNWVFKLDLKNQYDRYSWTWQREKREYVQYAIIKTQEGDEKWKESYAKNGLI